MQKVNAIRTSIDEKLFRQSILYTFILGFVAHGYSFANLIVSHDSLNDFFATNPWIKSEIGRIFYSVYITLTRGRFVVPWLIGAFALTWVSIAVYIVLQIFEIKKRGMIILVAGVFVCNPSVYALAATYIHDLDVDMFAMMLSVISTALWYQAIRKNVQKERYIVLLVGAMVLSVSIGIYQSYISLTIVLIILILIKEILEDKKFSNILKQGIDGIFMIASASVFYILEVKAFSLLTGITPMEEDTYNSLGNISKIFTGNIFEKVFNVYVNCFGAFRKLMLSSYPEIISFVIHGILVIGIIGIVLWGMKKIDWKNKCLMIILGIMMPFAMNVSHLLNNGVGHVLMHYAVWMIYLFVIILLLWMEEEERGTIKIKQMVTTLLMVCILIMIGQNIQTANVIYVKKDLEYQSTLSYMTRVVSKMEEQPEYISGETPVVFVGEESIGIRRVGFERYSLITGVGITSPITYYGIYENYFEYVLGTHIELRENEELEKDERVQNMTVFPKEGCMQMIDGTLVVKLNED